MDKLHNVVMLPTKNKAAFFQSNGHPELLQIGDNRVKNPYWTGQHLYLTSDEEIKKGDFFINTSSKTIHQSNGTEIFDYRKGNQVNFKIIATTDEYLKLRIDNSIGEYIDITNMQIPQIPKSFVSEYVAGTIEKVLVAYEEDVIKLRGNNTVIITIPQT